MPPLIELSDIRGDLQMHTQWERRRTTIEEMARAAQAKGYEYILITDSFPVAGVTNA